jgi:hypothetical protein
LIRYTLTCGAAHSFEGWFRNSEDFDLQCGRELVSCPVCGSTEVQKSLMAPAVSTSRAKAARQVADAPDVEPASKAAPAPTEASQQTALVSVDPKHREILEGLKSLRQKIVENSDYVGKNFAEEARKIHYGETEERNIYGETSGDDAKELLEEGIAVLPLPVLPEEQN